MSDVMTPKTPQWWKKPDVKKTAILWVICTAVIGYVGVEFHVRNMVRPASETMSGVISLMRIFTWAAAPVSARFTPCTRLTPWRAKAMGKPVAR